jgi:hypothetical protein
MEDSGAISVHLGQAKKIMESVWRLHPQDAFFLSGPSGAGKSAILEKMVAPDEGKFTLYGHSFNNTETNGILYVTDDGFADFAQLKSLPHPEKGDPEKGLLVIEEPNLAPPSIQGELMKLVYARVSGNYKLPDGYRVAACANRAKDKANVNAIPGPLRVRWNWLHIEPDLEDWIENFALDADIDWTITAFLRWKPDGFHEEPSVDGPFACGRTWERTDHIVKSGLGDDPDNKLLFDAAVAGSIGPRIGLEYIAYREVAARLPDLNKVALGEIDWAPDQKDMGLIYATISGLVSVYKKADKKKQGKIVPQLFKMSSRLTEEQGFYLLRDCYRTASKPIQSAQEFAKWATSNAKYLRV